MKRRLPHAVPVTPPKEESLGSALIGLAGLALCLIAVVLIWSMQHPIPPQP